MILHDISDFHREQMEKLKMTDNKEIDTRSLIKQVEDAEPKEVSVYPLSATNIMVGHKVALTRNTLGWSQEKLAEKVGLSRASIANIEGGRQKLDLDHVETFCLAFGMTPHHFMKGIWFVDGRR